MRHGQQQSFLMIIKKYLIDSNSNLLSYREELINDDLPKVFGNEAEKYFLDFFYILKKNNFQTIK